MKQQFEYQSTETHMKFKLAVDIHDYKPYMDIIIKELETNLNSPMVEYYIAEKWRISYEFNDYAGTRGDYWALNIKEQYTKDPWFTHFLLRWT